MRNIALVILMNILIICFSANELNENQIVADIGSGTGDI